VSAEADYVVNWYSATGLRRSIRRVVPPRVMDDSTAIEELDGGFSVTTPSGPCRIDPREEVLRRGFAPLLPSVHGISLAPDSTMWVVRGHLRTEAPSVDVFTQGGVYLGTLPTGSPVPVGFTPSGLLMAVERGEEGSADVTLYAVERRR